MSLNTSNCNHLTPLHFKGLIKRQFCWKYNYTHMMIDSVQSEFEVL